MFASVTAGCLVSCGGSVAYYCYCNRRVFSLLEQTSLISFLSNKFKHIFKVKQHSDFKYVVCVYIW